MNHRDRKSTESRGQPSTWIDLALYLIPGIGMYFLSIYFPFALLSIAGEWTVLHSFIFYLLNAIGLVAIVYVLGISRGKITWSKIGFVPIVWRWRWLLICILIIAISFPIRALLANWIKQAFPWDPFDMSTKGPPPNVTLVGQSYSFSWGKFSLTLLGFGILIPIAEELYFRGLIHGWFQSQLGPGLRLLLSSLIFGLWHLPATGTAAAGAVFGLIVAIAYERSRSIWLPIALHILNNSFIVVLAYLALLLIELGL